MVYLCGAFTWFAAACNEPDISEASAPSASAETDAPNFELDVLAVRDCEPEPHLKLGPDEYLLGVRVEIEAKVDDVPQNYYYGRLLDSEDRAYVASFDGCQPRLAGRPLKKGQVATGFINFRIPRRAHGMTLEYAPRVANSEKARGAKASRAVGR
jgi:hypothetical protein